MQNELLMQNLNTGLVITFIGMFTVLAFLTLMVFAIKISEKIIGYLNKIYPEEIKEKIVKKKTIQKNDEEIAIAILMALKENNKL